VPLVLFNGRIVNAYPELDEDGLYTIYNGRPGICVSYHCDGKFDIVDFIEKRNLNSGFKCGDLGD